MRAPRRAGRGDVQVAKLDRAQAGAAAQLPARNPLRGHGESLRVRVRGMPGSPSLLRPGPPRGRNLPRVRPRSAQPPPAARSPRRSGRAGADARTDRRSAGLPTPGPARSLVGMCLLSSLQLLPNPTGESWESEPAPGSWGEGSEGRESTGGGSRWDGHGAGTADRGQRPPGRRTEQGQRLGSGAIERPGPRGRGRGRRALGRCRIWDSKSEGRGEEGDLEEGSASDVGSSLRVHFHSSLQPLPWGVMFGCRDQRYQIAGGLIWGLGICHSAVQTRIFFFFFKQGLFSFWFLSDFLICNSLFCFYFS